MNFSNILLFIYIGGITNKTNPYIITMKNIAITLLTILVFLLTELALNQHSQIKEYEYRLRQSELINQLIEERKERERILSDSNDLKTTDTIKVSTNK